MVTFQLVALEIVLLLFALVLFCFVLGTQVHVSLGSPGWLRFRFPLPQLPACQEYDHGWLINISIFRAGIIVPSVIPKN